MKLPLIVAAAALLVVACGGAADVVVIGGEPDAGHLGALTQDASATVQADPPAPDASLPAASDAGAVASDAGADPAPDASADPSDAGEDASDADPTCTTTEIPDGWAPSVPGVTCFAQSASQVANTFTCPACLPFVYTCTTLAYFPRELLDAGGVFRGGMGLAALAAAGVSATCASVGTCVPMGQDVGPQWCDAGAGGAPVTCSPGVTPPAGCTVSGGGALTYCCPVADGG